MSDLFPCCVLQAEGLNFSYDSRKVLDNVNFTVRAGEMVTVVGPNGGGKSTLLKLILGLIEPTSGSLKVMGRDPVDARSVVGYVPQYAIFDDRFPVTVNEVVLTGRLKKRFGFYGKVDRLAAEEAMEQTSISDLAGNSFADLSGGQRQRVLIARALAGDPHIILLDEPTANVDAFMSKKFVDLLKGRFFSLPTIPPMSPAEPTESSVLTGEFMNILPRRSPIILFTLPMIILLRVCVMILISKTEEPNE